MANAQSSHYGKTFPALCRPQADVTIKLCLRRSQTPRFQCLVLEDGRMPEWYEAEELISLGACTTPNISARHSDAGECFLSQILQEENVPEKYFLSPKACAGILKRVARRGKALPPLLEAALKEHAVKDSNYCLTHNNAGGQLKY